MKTFWWGIFGGLVGAVVVVSAVETMRNEQPKLATIDLSNVMDAKVNEIMKKEDQESAKKEFENFGKHIDKIVTEMANEYQVSIMMKEPVLGGAPDLTMELKRRLSREPMLLSD
jgi:hypothetical protein